MRNSHRERHVGLREILALSQMSISRVVSVHDGRNFLATVCQRIVQNTERTEL